MISVKSGAYGHNIIKLKMNNKQIKTIDIIAGARPNFIKIAPLLAELNNCIRKGIPVAYRLIHTGQHYDRNMSHSFFEQLRIPEPDINFGVGGGNQSEQAGRIMIAYEKLLNESLSDICLVVGDVTSTMACAITAKKAWVPVAHVEGGIRSGDLKMPEEINRLVTDSIADWFFTTSEVANDNLRKNGVPNDRIYFVGNTMIDTLLKERKNFYQPIIWSKIGLQEKGFLVLTLHRPSNVDKSENLKRILDEICKCSCGLPLVFPVHPRTARVLESTGIRHPNLHYVDPLSYLEFNYLVDHSLGVITDSGGITEETTVMGVPCMTLRNSTERPETITIGSNELIGTDPNNIAPAMSRLLAGKWKTGGIPPLWDGKASERIISVLIKKLG